MDISELEREISYGKGLFTKIVRLTSDFLTKLESLGPAEICAFEQKRQRLLEDLLAFQSKLGHKLGKEDNANPLAIAKLLEEFRIFQEVFLNIIREKNSDIISQATKSRERLRGELDDVGRGKKAIRGYNKIRSLPEVYLDKSA